MLYLNFIAVILFASHTFALKYTDCGSKTGKITDAVLFGCEDSDVCELKRGETYSYRLTFDSLTDSKSLKAVVHGIMGGISMPYPIPNSDACVDGNIDCPIENGKSYIYANEIEVRKSYPSECAISIVAAYALKDLLVEEDEKTRKASGVFIENHQSPTFHVRADVKWELKDENNQDVACILIPVKIV